MPKYREVVSANNRFLLRVDPSKKRIAVCTNPPGPNANWEISHKFDFERFVVSNDGEVVIMIVEGSGHAQMTCLRFWNRQGEFKSYAVADLIKDPEALSQIGPGSGIFGSFWFVSPIAMSDDEFHITSAQNEQYTFSLKTGELLHSAKVLTLRQAFFLATALTTATFLTAIGSAVYLMMRYGATEKRRRAQDVKKRSFQKAEDCG